MDRKVETTLFKILDMVNLLRDEEGTLGSLAREALADMLGAPPTKDEVIAYMDDRSRKSGVLTTSEALAKFADDEDAIADIWEETKHDEEPIAEFLMLWDSDGNRQDPFDINRFIGKAPRCEPVWHVTPEEYR